MKKDLHMVIRGGLVVSGKGIERKDIGVRNGRIEHVEGDLPVHARFLHAYPLALISIHFRTICKGLELCLACGFIFPKIVTFLRIFAYHQLFAFMENMFYLIVHDAVSVIGLRNSGKANK